LAIAMKSFGRAGHGIYRWCSRALLTVGAISHRTQHLARLLDVTAPQQRGPLACEAIGLVRSHLSIGNDDAPGRRRVIVGAPLRLECLAVFGPVNDHFSNG